MFISAELDEVLRVANRVVIMVGGRIVDTIASEELDVDALTALVAQPDELDE
jgi:simple sugar transport system ATP-binding protein